MTLPPVLTCHCGRPERINAWCECYSWGEVRERSRLMAKAQAFGFAGKEIAHRCIPMDGEAMS